MAVTGGGSIPPLNVTIRINTTGAKTSVGAMRSVTQASGLMTRSMMAGSITTRTLGEAMRQTASLMKYTLVGAFMNVGKQAVQLSRNFELTFSRIRGLVGAGADQIDFFKDQVLGLAAETGKVPLELADALYFITSSGVRDARAIEVLRSSAKAAAAGLGETRDVADALTSVIQAYGRGSYDAAYATDILVAAVREGKAEADTFAPAFGKVLPVAAATGTSFEDVAAGIAALTRGGVSAGTAAIYIRQTLSQLLKPSKQGADALKAVGTSAELIRQQISEEGLFQALTTLQSQIGNNTAAFSKIFGNVRALTAVLSLVGPNADENRVIFERLQQSTGDLDYAFESYAETADLKFNKAVASAQSALIALGDAIIPTVTAVVGIGTSITSALTAFLTADNVITKITGNFLKFGTGAILAVAGITALLRTTASFIRLFSNFTQILQGTLFGVRGLTATILQANLAQQTNAAITAQQTLAQGRFLKSVRISTTLQQQFNVASKAGNLTQQEAIRLALQEYQGRKLNTIERLRQLALQRAFNIAQTQGNLTTAQATGLIGLLGSVANLTATAMTRLGIAMRFLGGAFGAVLGVVTIATLAVPAFQWVMRKLNNEVDRSKENLEDLNTILDESAKFGETEITVRANIEIDDARLAAAERIREQLGEEFFDRLQFEKDAGRAGQFIQAVLATTFGGVTEETRDLLKSVFAEAADITLGELETSILTSSTGDLVTDAIVFRAFGNLDRELSAAGNKALQNVEIDANAGLGGLSDTVGDIIEALPAQVRGNVGSTAKELGKQFEGFGSAFTEGIKKTGNLAPFLTAIEEIKKSTSDLDPALQSGILSGIVRSALADLGKEYQLVGLESGNFAEILANPENKKNLEDLFVKTLGAGGGAASARLAQLNSLLEKTEKGLDGAGDASGVVSDFFKEQIRRTKELDTSTQDLSLQIQTSETQFQDQVSAVKDAIDSFGKAKDAVDTYSSGVRALQGDTLTWTEQEIATRAALRDVADAFKDAGGNIVGYSEKSDQAKLAIRDYLDEVVKLAGIERARGNIAGAAQIIAEGTSRVYSEAAAKGISAIDVQSVFDQLGFNKDILSAFNNAGEAALDGGKYIAEQNAKGIEVGIKASQPLLEKVAYDQAEALLEIQRRFWGIESPSKVMAAQVGVPLAQGIAAGFSRESSGSRFKNVFGRELIAKINSSIKSAASKRAGFSAFAKSFLDAKKDVQTPVQDYVNAVVDRMRDVIGSLGSYLRSQLDFKKSQTDLLKLANTQRTLEAQRARTLREQAFAERRFGLRGGEEITDYEQARIDELQTAFERASRDYALGRATFIDVLDAEIALQDARESASEVNTDVIDAQNAVIDSQAELENAALNFAAAQVGVLESYLDLQQASIDLYWNQNDLKGIFDTVAQAAGVASGSLVIGGETIKDVGIKFNSLLTGVGLDLTDPSGAFIKNLKSLGPTLWQAIQIGLQESLDKSPLNLKISVNAIVDTKGGSGTTSRTDTDPFDRPLPPDIFRGGGAAAVDTVRTAYLRSIGYFARATGGPVKSTTPYMVGEVGPEMFIPKVSGTIVTASALDRYTRVRNREAAGAASGGNQIAVNVYNPVPEKASDSITRRMKVLSNSGLFG